MKAFILHGKQDLRPGELPRPTAPPGHVVLRVRRAGICGSDVHYFSNGRVADFVPKRPFVLGHEFAGKVVETGEDVEVGMLGRRVSVDPSMPCGDCRFCRSGRYNLCESMRYFGSASCDPHIDGGFAEFVAVPAANCLAVPDQMEWGEAAMIEPLSIAVHAVQRGRGIAGRSLAGQSVLVTGGGAIGQLVAMVVRAFAASQVTLSDLLAYPQQLALQQGADSCLDAADPDFEARALDLSAGGFDFVFEAAGSVQALVQGLTVARRGATIVQIGILPSVVTLPLNAVMARELNLIGSFRYADAFPMALSLAASKQLDLAPLISAVLPLAEMQDAMALSVGKNDVTKIQIEP